MQAYPSEMTGEARHTYTTTVTARCCAARTRSRPSVRLPTLTGPTTYPTPHSRKGVTRLGSAAEGGRSRGAARTRTVTCGVSDWPGKRLYGVSAIGASGSVRARFTGAATFPPRPPPPPPSVAAAAAAAAAAAVGAKARPSSARRRMTASGVRANYRLQQVPNRWSTLTPPRRRTRTRVCIHAPPSEVRRVRGVYTRGGAVSAYKLQPPRSCPKKGRD
jgi:hypothetical protein